MMTFTDQDLPIHLIARGSQDVGGALIVDGGSFETSGAEAVPLVLHGKATLHKSQVRPPVEVLEAVTAQISDLDRLGPPVLRPKVIKRFEESILGRGLIQSTLAGGALHWVEGTKSLDRKLLEVLGLSDEKILEWSRQLEACWRQQLSISQVVFSSARYSSEDLRREGLYLRSEPLNYFHDGRSMIEEGVRNSFSKVGPEWIMFHRGLRGLGGVRSQRQKALSEGRILAVVEGHGTFSLRPPWAWKETGKHPTPRSNWHFLLSRDLPREWLGEQSQLRGMEREVALRDAVSELEKRYLNAAPDHDRYKKDVQVKEVAESLGVSMSLMNEAWKKADLPNWKKQGRRKNL